MWCARRTAGGGGCPGSRAPAPEGSRSNRRKTNGYDRRQGSSAALEGAVDGGSGHGEEFGEVGDAVVAGGVDAAQLGLLLGGELGLAAAQPSGGSRHGYALAGAEPEAVDLECVEASEHAARH